MSYTSDQQLAAAGLRRLEDIPTRRGVDVMLRTRDGQDVEAFTLGNGAVDYLESCEFEDFIGWRPA